MIEFPHMPPEVKVAQAFLEHPDRHTNAELELARQRIMEWYDTHQQQIGEVFRSVYDALQTLAQTYCLPTIRQLSATFADVFDPTDLPTDTYLSHHPHHRAKLRAARRLAHQSVQARHLRRRTN